MVNLAAIDPVPLGLPSAFPDPIVSANVYCSGRLTEVLTRAVAPFWGECRNRGLAADGYVWVMRYARGGEHLKVRVHGHAFRSKTLRELLGAAVEAYLAAIGPPPPGETQKSRKLATPIDAEDWAPEDHPDRSLLWTTYERSHVSLCYAPYLNDDCHVALLTRCLARGTDLLLARLVTDEAGQCSPHLQQRLLLRALVAGLSGLPFTAEERSLYLLYHRDCLLRAALKQGGSTGGPQKMAETLDGFRAHVATLGRGAEALAAMAREHWERGGPAREDSDFADWRCAIAELADYVGPICEDVAYHVDPFADFWLFPPLFKAFHGLANQIGLNPLNEAFAHHLLTTVTAQGALRDRPVRLRPPIFEEPSAT